MHGAGDASFGTEQQDMRRRPPRKPESPAGGRVAEEDSESQKETNSTTTGNVLLKRLAASALESSCLEYLGLDLGDSSSLKGVLLSATPFSALACELRSR